VQGGEAMINLDEIERRAAAATAGPWTVEPYDYGAAVRGGCLLAECMQAATSKHATDVQECRTNAAFIAAARVDVPALIARVRELEAERNEARAHAEDRNDEANKLQRCLNMAATERDEARAEVERLTEARVLDWSHRRSLVSERDEARAEVERLKLSARLWADDIDAVSNAYRRGAEAMRDACASAFDKRDEHDLTVDVIHDVLVDLPIPEEP
jgi:chromosome segregation ATPase